ncbi:P-selectin-like isoform X2 [Babylonia areolata]|uniref:P-selectin-like isoform X2 n=1 Tax=Babylonia areolata TaxID=304850 RepID=UPI003FD4BF28
MVSPLLCVSSAVLFTLVSSHLPTTRAMDCPLDSGGQCDLEPGLGPCVDCRQRLLGPAGRVVVVGEGTRCQRARDSPVLCVDGKWIPTGHRSRRVKRGWLFWGRGGGGGRRETQHPPDISCPRDITAPAPRGKTSATVTWTVPTATDPNGGRPSVSQTRGPGPGSWFPEGNTLIEYTARDSTGRTDSCSFYVRVTVTYCLDSQRRSFGSPGSQRCSGGQRSNVFGSRCEHSCPTGFRLQGATSVVCQSNGEWDHAFPRCQVVSCGPPGQVPGGQVTCNAGHTFGQTCSLQCLPGLTSGQSLTTCSSAGKWRPTLQPCTDREAPTFPHGCPDDLTFFSGPLRSPVTVTWADPAVSDTSLDPVTVTSDPAKGSRLGVGVHTVTVTAVDGAGNEANCSFLVNVQAKQCPPLAQPANGHVTCTSDHVEGSECSFNCDEGYKVQGRSSLTCLGKRQWNSDAPTCEAVECPSPPEVERASFLCQQGHQFPADCTLICDPGYDVVGAAAIQCQANETWTLHGACEDTEAPRFVKPCPSPLAVYASRLGQDTHVTWPPPEASDNSGYDPPVTCNVTSGSSFPPGETTISCVASDESGNVQSCQFTVTVTVLQCPDPASSINNQSQLSFRCSDGHVLGARCVLQCGRGHSLLGDSSLQCERQADTHPPLMAWAGSSGERLLSTPQCKVDHCPRLEPPRDGSLSCLRGPVAWDCFLQCEPGWDVAASHLRFDGHFLCNGQQGKWLPDRVPDCVVALRPNRVRVHSELLYLGEECRQSRPLIRQHLITRLTNSVLRDACVHVPTCTARNVQVTCGPVSQWDRQKRAADRRFKSLGELSDVDVGKGRGGRGAASHHLRLSFDVTLSALLHNSSLSDSQLFQTVHQMKDKLTHSLTMHVTSGRLTLPHVRADVTRVGRPSVWVDCPPGTVLRPLHLSADRFSCVGCPEGHYLHAGTSRCQPCPPSTTATSTTCPP